MASKLVVFVCTGNICRSPMAEYVFREAAGTGFGWEACSAGLSASFGYPASREAVDVLRERGIELGAHGSRPLTPELVAAADEIVVMTRGHREEIADWLPEAASKKPDC